MKKKAEQENAPPPIKRGTKSRAMDYYETIASSDEPGWNYNTGTMYHDSCVDDALHFIEEHVLDNIKGTVKVENEEEQLVYAEWDGRELYVEGLIKEQFTEQMIEGLEMEFKAKYGFQPDTYEVWGSIEDEEEQGKAANIVSRIEKVKEEA